MWPFTVCVCLKKRKLTFFCFYYVVTNHLLFTFAWIWVWSMTDSWMANLALYSQKMTDNTFELISLQLLWVEWALGNRLLSRDLIWEERQHSGLVDPNSVFLYHHPSIHPFLSVRGCRGVGACLQRSLARSGPGQVACPSLENIKM